MITCTSDSGKWHKADFQYYEIQEAMNWCKNHFGYDDSIWDLCVNENDYSVCFRREEDLLIFKLGYR